VVQHKQEILDKKFGYRKIIESTLDGEFMNMMQTSIFVPLLHKDTPRPLKVP
jgi:hypothetical protein